MIQNNVGLHINTREYYKMYIGKNGVHCGNAEIIPAITEIVSLTAYSVPQGQMAQQPIVIGAQLATENIVCWLVLTR
jgi:hypothetical protein